MVQLVPLPFGFLVGRMSRELEQKRSVFDLPSQRFVQGDPGHDLSVAIHRHRASTPFGWAAGPHTQMAQTIVLSWLAGGRANLLKHRGYRRGWRYLGNLVKRMDEVGAADIDTFVLQTLGQADAALGQTYHANHALLQ